MFRLPADLSYNRGLIRDAKAYATENGCASWLCLTGDEFASMEDGISFDQIQSAVASSANVVSDPPRELDLELARRHVAVLDELPRPTLITCRTGPRASAVAYLYAGLRQETASDEVLAAAERDGAPFSKVDAYRNWLVDSLQALRVDAAAKQSET